MSDSHALRYRPEIDGLRALAVIPVVLYHAGFGFPGGYAGVDVFFVISGYLIGSAILREAEAGTFRFSSFWLRRLRRLFPAWVVVIAGTVAASVCFLVPPHLMELGESLLYQPTLGANIYFWKQTGYFETASEFQPLLHTWSLAVEEQFYLLLPLALLPLARFGRKITLVAVLAFVVASFVVSVFYSRSDPGFAFFMLPARIWELDFGVLLAVLALAGRQGFRTRAGNEVGVWSGITLIVLSYFLLDQNTMFPGYAALLPCAGAALVIFASGDAVGLTRAVLAHPLAVWIGKISYPLYLWHWPVLVFLRYLWIEEPPATVLVAACLASVALAWLTYRFVETPVRSRQWLGGSKELLLVAVPVSLVMMAAGLHFQKSKGLPGRFSDEVNRLLEPVGNGLSGDRDGIPSLRDVVTWKDKNDVVRMGEVEHPEAQLLLWGDSHAAVLTGLLHDLGRQYRVEVIVASSAGVAPVPGTYPAERGPEAMEVSGKVRDWLRENKVDGVLFVAKWEMYLFGRNDGELDRILRAPERKAGRPGESAGIFRDYFGSTIRELESGGSRVWVMETVGFQPHSVPETLARIASRGRDLNAMALPLSAHQENAGAARALLREAAEGTGAVLLDPLPYFADDEGRYEMASEGLPLYRDRDHLTPPGAEKLRSLLEPVFRSVVGN